MLPQLGCTFSRLSESLESARFAVCKPLRLCKAGLEQGAVGGAGREAEALEAALGIPVLRHAQKKPAGDAAEAEAHFGCARVDGVMIAVARLLRVRLAHMSCCVHLAGAFTSNQAHGPACSLG